MRHTLPRPILGSLRTVTGSTLHFLTLRRSFYTARVVSLQPIQQLAAWCAASETDYALIGGFYIREEEVPLGDLRIDGRALPSTSFDAPWDRIRACVHIDGGQVSLRSRIELPAEPPGDLLQAGPMLLRDGVSLVEPGADPEGFSSGAHQFDSDITARRYPRAALGMSATDLIAAVCDGRADEEPGLTLSELAMAMASLGATDAINLDGGGSASLVARRRLVNTPREEEGVPIPGGRPVPTALRFTPFIYSR